MAQCPECNQWFHGAGQYGGLGASPLHDVAACRSARMFREQRQRDKEAADHLAFLEKERDLLREALEGTTLWAEEAMKAALQAVQIGKNPVEVLNVAKQFFDRQKAKWEHKLSALAATAPSTSSKMLPSGRSKPGM